MNKTMLRKYAKLIAQTGANVQAGQEVFIRAGLDQPEFIKMLVEECYKCKAKKVTVEWDYQPLAKIHYRYSGIKTLGCVPTYEEERWKYKSDILPCLIYIESDDPDGLKGINQDKMAKAGQMRYSVIKPYRDKMESKYQWCIAAVPSEAWAKKVFPCERKTSAVNKLWDSILHICRVDKDNPGQAWEEHCNNLKSHCDYINSSNISKLHYTASNGTDLIVGLIEGSSFHGGSDETIGSNIVFNANMPTEECFISPKRGDAEGIVYSSKPLSYNGQLIDNFWIRFHEGKAVDWHAETNNDLLTYLLNMDEGAKYLGECALVPFDSPISQSGILFYSTLFDENASCHLALGCGYPETLDCYNEVGLEGARKLGINESMIHEDFMIGTADMNIDGITRDGKTISIFKNGNWAF